MSEVLPRLEAFRKAKGLTYDQIGLRIGRTGTQAQRICKGVSQPRRDAADALRDMTCGEIHAGNCHDMVSALEAAEMMVEIARREAAASAGGVA